jgi:hypothetical protein
MRAHHPCHRECQKDAQVMAYVLTHFLPLLSIYFFKKIIF